MNFKAGDKLRRINDNTFEDEGMIVGNIYTFKEYACAGREVRLEEIKDSWILRNFELVEEKDMDTFSKKDLKTGMIVISNDTEYLVLKDSVKGDVLVSFAGSGIYGGFCWLDSFSHELKCMENEDFHISKVMVTKCPDHSNLNSTGYEVIWERKPDLTPDQIKQQELQAKYDVAKKELEELGRALGTVK